ncbi:MAG: hypothetical protein AB7J13_04835 [Pyrinomonadaceae bacterium]
MSNDWFWEGNVVESLEKHFRKLDWSFVSKADTATRQTGIDLHMRKGDIELRIEAKGYPSELYQRGPKQGTPKRTRPATQARHWYAEALLCSILRQNDHPTSIIAIAFPEFDVFTNLANRTGRALEKLGLRTIFVSETGDVRIVGDPI